MARAGGLRKDGIQIGVLTRIGPRSFKARILALFLGLFISVQAAVFIFVNRASTQDAEQRIRDALDVTASVFERLIAEREQRLVEAARLLSGDFAFKQAYATRDAATVLSALDNHRARIQADVMMLVTMDDVVMADTLHPAAPPRPFDLAYLVRAAGENEYSEAAAPVFIDGLAYRMVVVPLLVPMPDAWICAGFLIDDRLVAELQRMTRSHVTLVGEPPGRPRTVLASTLPLQARRDVLARGAPDDERELRKAVYVDLAGERYVSYAMPLAAAGSPPIVAALQRSLDEALAPYRRLQGVLALLFAAGALLAVVGGALVAGTVTRPVKKLAAGVRKIDEGDYSHRVEVARDDELGRLAEAFNGMTKGLAERDRVRDLLGKVVSSAIAEELLKREIELGGEEREVTVLFSDLRGFTSLCERYPARDVLSLLNMYLTRIGSVIEANGGVVDKYIGDAVMALYGAPIRHEDDAARAVRTALGMCRALAELNAEFVDKGLPGLDIGIGINTAVVVAGNMGSASRLNYTVVGDGVNVASRLEGLSKRYGVKAVVSGATRALAPGFVFRELDRVRVKGKALAVSVYEPVGEIGAVGTDEQGELDAYGRALDHYHAGQDGLALDAFTRLVELRPDRLLYRIYLERLAAPRSKEASEWPEEG